MRRLRALGASVWLVVASLAFISAPSPVFACSCMAQQPIEAYATDENVIFAGEVLGPDQPGVRFGVEQWFSGTEPAGAVRIAGDWENGGMCGLGFVPDAGTRWIAVAWRPPSDDPLAELHANENLQVSICQPFLDLDTPEGQQLFDDAVAAFGNVGAPPDPGASPSPVPAAPAEPTATATNVPAAPVPAARATAMPVPAAPASTGMSPETMATAAVAGVLAMGVLVLVVVAVVGRRSRSGG